MAQVFPLGEDDGAHDDIGLTLAGRLASLPQDLDVLRDPKLDGDAIDAVLVHPERGLEEDVKEEEWTWRAEFTSVEDAWRSRLLNYATAAELTRRPWRRGRLWRAGTS